MKIMLYGLRRDEGPHAVRYAEKFGWEVKSCHEILQESTAHLAEGCDAAFISVSCQVDAATAKILQRGGVKYLLTRSAGIDHIDVDTVLSLGIQIANVPAYSPNAVSEHTVMMTIEVLRNMREQQRRIAQMDFSIEGMCGREIHNLTTGVIGTGRIGTATVQNFSGFGGKLYAYDPYPSDLVAQYAEYLPLEEIYARCDILIFLCPLTDQTKHMVDRKAIQQMKGGVVLVNTSRGALFDWEAVRDGLKEGKIGGLAFDVIEGERPFIRKNMEDTPFEHPVFKELLSMPRTLYTAHAAFYTDEAVENMVGIAFMNLNEFLTTGDCKNKVTKGD
jgi:D-lactate dehydrogenase